MTITHELGHLLGGWIGGATLKDFSLAPLPYSLHRPDPLPLLTLWAGPIFGIAAPMLVAFLSRWQPARFVADFCLLANGIYLALAWLSGDRLLDTARVLEAGGSVTSIALFCGVTVSIGYVRFRADCVELLANKESSR